MTIKEKILAIVLTTGAHHVRAVEIETAKVLSHGAIRLDDRIPKLDWMVQSADSYEYEEVAYAHHPQDAETAQEDLPPGMRLEQKIGDVWSLLQI